MSELVWTADLNTGIDVIDGQHQQIVDFINRLNTVRTTGDGEEIGSIIDGLVDYTLLHFAFEEALLAEAGYAALPGHQKVHDLFAKRIQSFQERFASGESIADELHGLLSHWLISHIRNDDAAYASTVRGPMLELVKETHSDSWLARLLQRIFGASKH